MSRLTDLLRRVSAQDAQLGSDLEREFQALSDRRAFGLNFERHQPEAVELPGRAIRKNDKVRVLPPRGSTANRDSRLWRVSAIDKQEDESVADLMPVEPDGGTNAVRVRVKDLVYVAEFRDPIYPGLTSTGRVERSEQRPFHAVVNAENFHDGAHRNSPELLIGIPQVAWSG